MAVLQAVVEAVKLGTKESFSQDNDDISIKHVRAWSKLLKDCLNQKGSRGETPVMVACEEGYVTLHFPIQVKSACKALNKPVFTSEFLHKVA